MTESDMIRFSELIDATMPIYRMETSKETKRLWWNILKSYSFEVVANAFGAHLRVNAKGITPADICQLIDKANPDGRPGVEEAWAMLPKDESTSAVMTNEMAEAMGITEGLDPIAGRMAFREAYSRIVDQNRREGIPPKWFPSLGTDKEGREIVLMEAARIGRLSQTQVAGLLPPPEGEGTKAVLALISTNGILTDSNATEEDKISARERIDKLKAMLGGREAAQ